MASFNINTAGFVIVGMFVVTWAGAARHLALRARRREMECPAQGGRGLGRLDPATMIARPGDVGFVPPRGRGAGSPRQRLSGMIVL